MIPKVSFQSKPFCGSMNCGMLRGKTGWRSVDWYIPDDMSDKQLYLAFQVKSLSNLRFCFKLLFNFCFYKQFLKWPV